MKNFELDFSYLYNQVVPKEIDRIPVKGNESKMRKVAFDLFRLDGDNKEDLWIVQADDDGNQFLYRTYNLPEEEEKQCTATRWSVLLDKKASNLTVLFNDVPITRIAMKDYGIDNNEDAQLFSNIVFKKLASDKEFVEKFLTDLPQEKLEFIMGPMGRGQMGRGQMGRGPGVPFCQYKDFPINPSQNEDLVLVLDTPTKKCSEEHPESCSPPEGEAQDSEEWWDNLTEKEKEEVFKDFEKKGSITKAQVLSLIKLEAKLSK